MDEPTGEARCLPLPWLRACRVLGWAGCLGWGCSRWLGGPAVSGIPRSCFHFPARTSLCAATGTHMSSSASLVGSGIWELCSCALPASVRAAIWPTHPRWTEPSVDAWAGGAVHLLTPASLVLIHPCVCCHSQGRWSLLLPARGRHLSEDWRSRGLSSVARRGPHSSALRTTLLCWAKVLLFLFLFLLLTLKLEGVRVR